MRSSGPRTRGRLLSKDVRNANTIEKSECDVFKVSILFYPLTNIFESTHHIFNIVYTIIIKNATVAENSRQL